MAILDVQDVGRALADSLVNHTSYRSESERYVMGSVFAVMAFMAFFGNLFVIVAGFKVREFSRRRSTIRVKASGRAILLETIPVRYHNWRDMDNATLVTVISLAFTDVVSGALLFTPNVANLITDDWVLPTFLCPVIGFLHTYLKIVAILHVFLITAHKVIVIRDPFQQIVTVTRMKLGCLFLWIISSVPQITPFFGIHPYIYDSNRATCCADMVTDHPLLVTFYTVFWCSLPLTLTVALYFYLLKLIINMSKKSVVTSNKGPSSSMKAFKTVFIVITAFLLCIGPFVITILWAGIFGAEVLPGRYVAFEHFATSANSVVNPIVYVYTNNTFKEFCVGFITQFCQKRHQRIRPDRPKTLKTGCSLSPDLEHKVASMSNSASSAVTKFSLLNVTPINSTCPEIC